MGHDDCSEYVQSIDHADQIARDLGAAILRGIVWGIAVAKPAHVERDSAVSFV
jgi:hypothetical protein